VGGGLLRGLRRVSRHIGCVNSRKDRNLRCSSTVAVGREFCQSIELPTPTYKALGKRCWKDFGDLPEKNREATEHGKCRRANI
jgi:hypothetical protein